MRHLKKDIQQLEHTLVYEQSEYWLVKADLAKRLQRHQLLVLGIPVAAFALGLAFSRYEIDKTQLWLTFKRKAFNSLINYLL